MTDIPVPASAPAAIAGPGAGPVAAVPRAAVPREAVPREADARTSMVVPLIIGVILFMQTLDSTIIATALPSIARSLGADPLHLNLAITAYLLSLAIFIPLSGWVADRFGALHVFRAAIAVFTIGSVLCGAAQSLPELVGARFLQGLGGAMMVPVGRLVLLKSVPKSELVRAMSFLTMPAMLGPILGPPLGGLIVTWWSWRWIFLINVPIGAVGILLATLFIRNLKEADVPPLDLPGFLLSALALGGLVFGFEAMGRGVLPAVDVALLLAGGAACGVAYLVRARRVAHPIIDFGLLRQPTFLAGTIGGGLSRVTIAAGPFLLALLFQIGFGLSPLQSGLLTFASGAGALAMKFVASPIVRRFGFRPVLAGAAVLSAVLMMACGLFRPSTPIAVMLAVLLVGGFFRSLLFTTVNALSYADVPPNRMSGASSLASMLQQLSLTLGVGVAAVVLNVTHALRGGASLTVEDCTPAFLLVGLISLGGLWFFLRLRADAGDALRGRA